MGMMVGMSQTMFMLSTIVPELKDENAVDDGEVSSQVGLSERIHQISETMI